VGYANTEADDLIVRIRREYDREEQKRLTRRLHRIIAGDQPYTFLYATLGTLVLDRKIVMVEKNDSYSQLKRTQPGNVFFYFKQWKKLEFAPSF
jgi:ABC-type transport system substrate-binding protein